MRPQKAVQTTEPSFASSKENGPIQGYYPNKEQLSKRESIKHTENPSISYHVLQTCIARQTDRLCEECPGISNSLERRSNVQYSTGTKEEQWHTKPQRIMTLKATVYNGA